MMFNFSYGDGFFSSIKNKFNNIFSSDKQKEKEIQYKIDKDKAAIENNFLIQESKKDFADYNKKYIKGLEYRKNNITNEYANTYHTDNSSDNSSGLRFTSDPSMYHILRFNNVVNSGEEYLLWYNP